MSNTRLLLLRAPGEFRNPGSRFLPVMLRRLSAPGWRSAYGHDLELVETFVDPEKDVGTVYRALSRVELQGGTKGYARAGGG